MVRSTSMGLGSMFVVLVVAIVFLPMIVRYVNSNRVHFAGFTNMGGAGGPTGPSTAQNGVANIPAIGSASKLPTWRPDPNTNYLCRSPNEDGNPCPEGYFCDGTTQSCIPTYVGNTGPWTGYFS
jgi:hypothetical protein